MARIFTVAQPGSHSGTSLSGIMSYRRQPEDIPRKTFQTALYKTQTTYDEILKELKSQTVKSHLIKGQSD